MYYSICSITSRKVNYSVVLDGVLTMLRKIPYLRIQRVELVNEAHSTTPRRERPDQMTRHCRVEELSYLICWYPMWPTWPTCEHTPDVRWASVGFMVAQRLPTWNQRRPTISRFFWDRLIIRVATEPLYIHGTKSVQRLGRSTNFDL